MPIRSLRPARAGAATTLVGLGLVVALGVTGCTGTSPTPSTASSAPVASSSSGSVAPSATPDPTPTSYDAHATTPQALAYFDSVVKKLLTTDPQPHGLDVINALVTAGFDKKAMEITPDTTTIGRNVDSIEFSVLWRGKDCLVGQVGESGYGSSSSPVLSTGKCLIGATRSIN